MKLLKLQVLTFQTCKCDLWLAQTPCASDLVEEYFEVSGFLNFLIK